MKIYTPKIRQGFHRMGSRYGHLFDRERFMKRSLWDGNLLTPDTHPYANLKIAHDFHKIEIAVPGFKKEELSITIHDNLLTIEGKKKRTTGDETKFIRQEYSLDTFKKVFTLPPEINKENIQSHQTNGVLTIKLHFRPEARNKQFKKQVAID
jgi:HSP20 family protein